MQIKHAPNDVQSMSQDGDAILRSLQNKSLPVIDLMVRESLQNSLDATKEHATTTNVDFYTGTFNSENLANHLEGIEDVLKSQYGGTQQFLAVSDKNTYGLTGDYKSNDANILNNSNFHKLVFGIGKNQDKDGAGGSWGLGKTSYFRLGLGIVFYYTRLAVNGSYEERLIASLIESPKQGRRLLPNNERGIAWWGDFAEDGEKIYPITNSEIIEEILMIFNLKCYVEDETGTTIIIPYLDSVENANSEEALLTYSWEKNRESAILMAVQRWYFPRIENEKYRAVLGNSKLTCRVNNQLIHPAANFEPTFKIFQDLYTAALVGQSEKPNIHVEKIDFGRSVMENRNDVVGHIAFCEVSREELEMLSPNNKPSSLAYVGVKDTMKIEQNISKIVAYSRKPGMVVEYSIDGPWTPSEFIQKDDHLLFAFFVPNSHGRLNTKYREMGYETVEQYLRATENSDHATWVDEANISIISRMKRYSAQAIKNIYQNEEDHGHTSATSALSRKFGALLMPPKNFGKTSSHKTDADKKTRDSSSKNRMSDITVIESMPKTEQAVEVAFKAFIKQQSCSEVYLQVLTQEQKMDTVMWEKSMGDFLFPFSIEKFELTFINGKSLDECENYDLELSLEDECLRINLKVNENIELEGVLELFVQSNDYIPNLAIRTV